MPKFYENLSPEDAARIDQLTKLGFELRENRKAVLAAYGVADAAQLLERIAEGAVAEHPAYEHYLAARILEATRQAAREELAQMLRELQAR